MSGNEEHQIARQASAALESVLADIEEHRRGEGQHSPNTGGWARAKEIVKNFTPVPWFIWRIGAVCFGSSGPVADLPEGLFVGLKKLVLRASADPLLAAGQGSKTNLRDALRAMDGSTVAAVCILHALSRRLHASEASGMIAPLLDEAFARAQLGFLLGDACPGLAPGRGMLAGYFLKIGLPVLMALGSPEEQRRSLSLLAEGKDAEEVGLAVYGCGPLQFSALLASLIGASADAARGLISLANNSESLPEGRQAREWYCAYRLIQHLGQESINDQPEMLWDELGILDPSGRSIILDSIDKQLQKPCSWEWLR